MHTPALLPADFYRLRFSDELVFPEMIRLDTKRKRVHIKQTLINLHSALPDTPIFAYTVKKATSELINPSFEVESGHTTKLEWVNELQGESLPIVTATAEYKDEGPKLIPQNHPGTPPQVLTNKVYFGIRKADETFIDTADIPSITVAHLHGGNNEANSDGWPENTLSPGQAQLDQYSNRQPSCLLWYHDHAIHITRLNVYAGLAGFYMIRDDNDRRVIDALDLHEPTDDVSPHYELPLLLQDCNLDTDAEGFLNGKLLHKVEAGAGPMEFFGPYTMVNKKIWPKCTVKRRQYRLRLLNGSNARTFRLTLLADNDPNRKILWSEVARQIGTDGGLLPKPIDPGSDLVLAPAERLDLIVDFSAVAAESLTVVNTAGAPFNGKEEALPAQIDEAKDNTAEGQQLLLARVRYPAVMRFDLTGQPEVPRALPALLNEQFRRIVHDAADSEAGEPVIVIPETAEPGHHAHRYVALVEEALSASDETKILTLRELLPYAPENCMPVSERLIKLSEPDPNNPAQLGPPKLYRTAARFFHDDVTFVAHLGEIEVWKVINLSPDTHPIHIHLTQMQVIGRVKATEAGCRVPNPETLDWLAISTPVDVVLDQEVPINESDKAWKDVIRVDPGEMVKIALPFGTLDTVNNTITAEGFSGKYVYHCHILEHEDHDMMRPFVVLPKAIAALMHHPH